MLITNGPPTFAATLENPATVLMPVLEVQVTSIGGVVGNAPPALRLAGNSSDCVRCLPHVLTPTWCHDAAQASERPPHCGSGPDPDVMQANGSFFFEITPSTQMDLILHDLSVPAVATEANASSSSSSSVLWRLDHFDFEPLVQYKLQVDFSADDASGHRPVVHFDHSPVARDWRGLVVALLVFVCAWAFVRTTTSDIARPKWNQYTQLGDDAAGEAAAEQGSSSAKPLVATSENRLGQPTQNHKSARFASLDIFRGITMCAMVFVNYGGGGYRFFTHSIWNGLTFADVVFPWFAWIMGFSLFISQAHKTPRAGDLWNITWRSIKLVGIGLFLNQSKSLEEWRFPGVLQALGFAFFVVSMVFQCSWPRDLPARVRFCGIWAFVIGVINLCVVFFVKVMDCPRGYIGPGGMGDFGKYDNCTGGAHLVVDRMLFGEMHLYQHPTIRAVYDTGAFDPEGFLNMLMISVTCFFGFFTAFSIKRHQFLLVCGCMTILVSLVLHHLLIPMNKNLWSLSYVLCSTGLACLALCACTLLDANPDEIILECDGSWKLYRWTLRHWIGQVFARVGRNAIGIYVMHEVCTSLFPFSLPADAGINTREDHLLVVLLNIATTLWWIGVACWMHHHRVYIRV